MGQILTDRFATHTGILTSIRSTCPSGQTSTPMERSPTHGYVICRISESCLLAYAATCFVIVSQHSFRYASFLFLASDCISFAFILLSCSVDAISHDATSVLYLSPGYFRRRASRPVSYYALFKWWLLLSQHPGCLGSPTSFST